MADTEKNEDQKISRCLQEAFGYTDEQLLKQLDQANETLKDVTFDGAEDRIMKKIMARKAELEKETSAPEPETERNITLVKAETEDRKDKKIVRFGKKKVMATVALVAVIAGMLGGTAVGKKNYFLRYSKELDPIAVVDNDKNKIAASQLESAYTEIAERMNIPVLKLKYCPEELLFKEYVIYKGEAQLFFSYGQNIIVLQEMQKGKRTSLKYEFDGQEHKKVFNKWLNMNIEYYSGLVDEKTLEFETLILIDNQAYYISGSMPEEEWEKILEHLNFN